MAKFRRGTVAPEDETLPKHDEIWYFVRAIKTWQSHIHVEFVFEWHSGNDIKNYIIYQTPNDSGYTEICIVLDIAKLW